MRDAIVVIDTQRSEKAGKEWPIAGKLQTEHDGERDSKTGEDIVQEKRPITRLFAAVQQQDDPKQHTVDKLRSMRQRT